MRMDLAALLSAVGAVGFPAVVALYLLVRVESRLRDLNHTLTENTIILRELRAILTRMNNAERHR